MGPGEWRGITKTGVAAAANPILDLDPNADWTSCFNDLIDWGPLAMAYLADDSRLQRPVAPDNLAAFVRLSLMRMLADPAGAPELSAMCLETRHDVLFFEVKADGRSLGTAAMIPGVRPRSWLDLYWGDFNAAAAEAIDLEGDRQKMLAWWRDCRAAGRPGVSVRGLRPQMERLWPVLATRMADRWTYELGGGLILCSAGTAGGTPRKRRGPYLFEEETADYNLVRAACIQLGRSSDSGTEERLIQLVGSPQLFQSHNAVFALQFSTNQRIREVLRAYNAVDSR